MAGERKRGSDVRGEKHALEGSRVVRLRPVHERGAALGSQALPRPGEPAGQDQLGAPSTGQVEDLVGRGIQHDEDLHQVAQGPESRRPVAHGRRVGRVEELLGGWEGRDPVPGEVEGLGRGEQVGQVHREAQGPLDERPVQVKFETLGGAEQGLLPEARVEARSELGLLTSHRDTVLEHPDRGAETVRRYEHVDVSKHAPRRFRVDAVGERDAFEHAGFDAGGGETFERVDEEMLES